MKIISIRLRKEFLLITAKGNKAIADSMILFSSKPCVETPEKIRIGFTVSKKIGNAVKRNRVKRRLRAVSREIFIKYSKLGFDYIIIARKEALTRKYSCLINDMIYTLKKSNTLVSQE